MNSYLSPVRQEQPIQAEGLFWTILMYIYISDLLCLTVASVQVNCLGFLDEASERRGSNDNQWKQLFPAEITLSIRSSLWFSAFCVPYLKSNLYFLYLPSLCLVFADFFFLKFFGCANTHKAERVKGNDNLRGHWSTETPGNLQPWRGESCIRLRACAHLCLTKVVKKKKAGEGNSDVSKEYEKDTRLIWCRAQNSCDVFRKGLSCDWFLCTDVNFSQILFAQIETGGWISCWQK